MALNLDSLKTTAKDAVDSAATKLHELSDSIWAKPELAYEEHHAHDLLTDYLESQGFSVERHYVVDTAFRATFGGAEEGPHVGVMCEYDALPGIGHACGHNLIAEVGIAAALGIKAALEKAGNKLGKLVVLGCPAEEGQAGKVVMLEAKAFDDLAVALMAHPWSVTGISSSFIGREKVKVTYRGRASHASAAPWEGVNALDAVVMAYSSVSCLRQQIKPTWRVHGVITNGGEKPNIIPEEASMEYYIRAPTMGELKVFRRKVTACFDAAAAATGCTVEYNWDPRPYENMIHNATLASLYEANARNLGVEFTDLTKEVQASGSTDMGNVSHVVPSIHPVFDIGTTAANHTRDFTTATGADKAQPFTLAQGKALAMTALDVFCNPHLLPKMQEEFKADLARDAMMA